MGKSQARMLGDLEVQEVRRVQAGIRIFDVKRQRFVQLPDLLRPGEPLYEADAVFIGELHDSNADHTMQRLIIDSLTYQLFLDLRREQGVDATASRGTIPQNASPKRIVVGVEYIARQQQELLDRFVFGKDKMSLDQFRKDIDWDNTWSFDWQLYEPLFRFCRLNATRVVGLNVPFEVSLEVSRNGMSKIPKWLKDLLPDLDLSKVRHRRRFEDMLTMPMEDAVGRWSSPLEGFSPRPALDKMYDSQTLWDEYMAETAWNYLEKNGGRLVVLAGINHVWRDSIPDRLEARAARSGGPPLHAVSLVPWRGGTVPSKLPTCADYVWCTDCPGGGTEASKAMEAQRLRLAGKSRIFPAGYI